MPNHDHTEPLEPTLKAGVRFGLHLVHSLTLTLLGMGGRDPSAAAYYCLPLDNTLDISYIRPEPSARYEHLKEKLTLEGQRKEQILQEARVMGGESNPLIKDTDLDAVHARGDM
ncbi:hypothetical protein NQZ68_012159 [Dissostichus eleginoides]|nr:hypothetical protein NQZ68_012159 [Dissostichus eleginoides]